MIQLNFTLMKKMQKNLQKWIVPFGIIGLLAVVLSSCSKSNTTTYSGPLSALAVIDASPDAPSLDFYVGSNKVSGTALGLGNFFYYFSLPAGGNDAIFYQTGTTSAIAQSNITLSANTYYTLFIANVKATPDLILLKDSVYQATTGKTSIRFVDVSPDAPNIDFILKGGAKIASNLTYKGSTAFLPVPLPGTGLDTLQIVQTGTTNVLATVPAANLVNTGAYTVWFYGLANTSVTAEGLNANIMADVFFN
jgi:hypothetical protein